MPGSHLWDNQVLCPQLPSHSPSLHLTAEFISLNLCLHYITSVIKTYNGVCLPVYWFMPKYFNVAFLALHKLRASYKFYFLAGWLPISPVEQSYLHHQPFTNCFFPCLSQTPLSKYFKSYPSFKAPTLSSLQLFFTTPLPTMEAPVGGSSHFPGFMIFSPTVSYFLVLYSQIQHNIF